MNITVTQDNSRIEQLGSNGAGIVLKLYDLAVDPNNTVNLQGNIKTNYAYGYQVDYLNNKYNPDFIVSANDRYIPFEDAIVLNALIHGGIGDSFGISEQQLNSVSVLDGETNAAAIKQNKNITSFVELMYFNNLTTLQNSPFYQCTNLKKIGFPQNVLNISSWTFEGCRVEKVIFKNTINNFFISLWGYRGPLLEFDFSGRKVDLCINSEDNVIYNVNIPANLNLNCRLCNTTLKTITFENGIQKIPVNFIEFSHNLESVVIPESVTSIGGANFYDCPKLKKLDLPSQISYIDQYVVGGSTYLDVAIIRSTTPPTGLDRSNLTSSGIIYVPDESVDSYKSTSPWSGNANIRPISQYATDFPNG